MQIDAESFKDCQIDLYGNPNIEGHPIFEDILKDIIVPPSKRKELNNILTYTVAFYDRKSPFQFINEFNSRKASCAEFAKFKVVREGKFSASYQGVLNCNEAWYCDIVIGYCRHQGNMDWTQVVTLTQQFYDIQAFILRPNDDKDVNKSHTTKMALSSKMSSLRESIDSSMNSLLSSERNLNLRDRVFFKAALESKELPALTPELFSVQE